MTAAMMTDWYTRYLQWSEDQHENARIWDSVCVEATRHEDPARTADDIYYNASGSVPHCCEYTASPFVMGLDHDA